jgi:hypothetical protein
MKKVLFTLLLAIAGTVTVNAQSALPIPPANGPVFHFFGGLEHYYMNLPANRDASHVFLFKNIGKAPLVVTGATTSCTCLTVDFTSDPVNPGARAQINVSYNTTGKVGPFMEKVFVTSNAPGAKGGGNVTELVVKGVVLPEPPVTANN